ncbi:MAG: hypothetical protein ACKV0T_28435 [Planctomycetales bacterium]
MGAIADSIVAYAQPLLDQTDGSSEQLNKALMISQLCWNMSLAPEDRRELCLRKMRIDLGMDDTDFGEFRKVVINPMIRRHLEMFPHLHRRHMTDPWQNERPPSANQTNAASKEKYPGTEPYAPCPCDSGRKYKFCCKKIAR